MQVIRFELKRAFNSLAFKISLLISFGICFADLTCFLMTKRADKILIQAWIGTDFAFAFNSLFYVLLPILACLPYAGSYYSDMSSGYDKNICIHVSRQAYARAKVVAVFCISFVSLVLPLGVELFICAGLFPNRIPEKLNLLSAGILDRDMFPILFHKYPVLYCSLYMFIDGMFAGVLGLIALSVSRFVKNKFSAIMFPFILYILTGVVMTSDKGTALSVMEMVNPVQRYVMQANHMGIIFAVLLVTSLLITWIWSRKRDVL